MRSERHLHLVRHAESQWNAERRYQGQGDSELTAAGRAHAEQLADWLVEHVGTEARVIASDLGRARATAAPFAARAGAELALDRRFREVDIGHWTGRLFTEIAAEHPDLVAAAGAGRDVRRGDGETFADMRVRVSAAIDGLAEPSVDSLPGDARSGDAAATTVVFTHGGPIRVAAAAALGIPAPGHHRIAPPTNCSISSFTLIDGHWRLRHYNRPTVVQPSTEPSE